MLSDFIRTHKLASGIIFILLVGIVVFFAVIFISRIGKEPVRIYLIPDHAQLTIEGQGYRPGTVYIKPGTYRVKAELEGFETYEETVTISQPNTTDIDIALNPVSDEAWEWLRNNADAYQAFEGRAGARANIEGVEFSEKNPIVDQLPQSNFIYTVGYSADPDVQDGIILTIDAITGYRQAALDRIRELGYDPTDFKINFRNYENPF